jgi:hypothetical protein
MSGSIFVGILEVLATRPAKEHIARWMEALAFIRFYTLLQLRPWKSG